MFIAPTLNRYLLKKYLGYFLAIAVVFIFLLFISNIFDTFQKFKSDKLELATFWKLSLLKVPMLFNQVSVLLGFVSTVLFLQNLLTKRELLIILVSGVQSWRVFFIPVLGCFVFGIILTIAVSPLVTFSLSEYKKMERILNREAEMQVKISQNGIFFYESIESQYRLIQAKYIDFSKNSLGGVTVVIIDENNNFLQRYDSDFAILNDNIFDLFDVMVIDKHSSIKLSNVKLFTNLSIKDIKNKISSPELIPIWDLKNTIERFAASGINTTPYELYYYRHIFMPITMASMVLLACIFLSLNTRSNLGNKLIVLSILFGIFCFFVIEIFVRVMVYAGISPMVAYPVPSIIIAIISNFVILHFQEA